MKKILITICLLAFFVPSMALAECTVRGVIKPPLSKATGGCLIGETIDESMQKCNSAPENLKTDPTTGTMYYDVCCCVDTAASSTIMYNPDTTQIVRPILQKAIPGFGSKFSAPNCYLDTDGRYLCKISWIGEYFSAIYKYAVGIIGILAAIMILIGGVMWNASGGNQEKISQDKKRITGGLLGMFLVLGSYMILSLINPDLVNLKPVNVKVTKVIPQTAENAPVGSCPTTPLCTDTAGCRDCVDCANMKATDLADKLESTTTNANRTLIQKMSEANKIDSNWAITEAWPPTMCHSAKAQWEGNSVDVGVRNNGSVKSIYDAFKNSGATPVFECSPKGCCAKHGLKVNKNICIEFEDTSHITADHFSIYQ